MNAQQIAQLRWACRRGRRELDLLLSPFFEDCFAALTPTAQRCFEQLLTFDDQLLFTLFFNPSSVTALELSSDLSALLRQIRYHQGHKVSKGCD